MTINTDVNPGSVRLSTIYSIIDTDDVKIVYVDANSKRYNIEYWDDFENDQQVTTVELVPNDDSLKLDENLKNHTEIVFTHKLGTRWLVTADPHARYGFQIVFVRQSSDSTHVVLWDEDDNQV